ncbi:hypothetical protein D6D21_08606 [Aureobasidium pullulans]|uniref:BZIP domain-containing protein n=1 Tax=Aureobasidium pullulans TaxID=5580 RepID=A0AB74IQ41_AURPU|nr:hypothetical protein D6D21_08606 [Aureobasidium pullulans]
MAPCISLFSRALKMGAKQNSVQARITKAMCHTVESASEENEKLNDENERLRLRNYELKRELEEVYRKLWETEIERDLLTLPQSSQKQHSRVPHFTHCSSPNTHPNKTDPCTTQTRKQKRKTIPFAVTMEAAVEKQNDLINLLHEHKIALSEAKVAAAQSAAAQSAAAVTKIIDENMQLKHEVERLQAENKELRLKLWDATEEERMMDAGRLGDVLKVL